MKSLAVKKYNNTIPVVLVLIFFILIILYPKQSYLSALSGLEIFLNSVFPALLPFFIVSELLNGLGVIDFLSVLLNPLMQPLFRCSGHSSFIWIISATSGYPAGARLVAMLRKSNKIDAYEAQRILSFCSTSGPLFMLGAVAIGMLNSVEGGTIILISHYLASILIGLLFRFYKSKNLPRDRKISIRSSIDAIRKSATAQRKPFGELMADAVNSAINTLVVVGGFIILFAVVINLLIEVGLIETLAIILADLLKPFLNLNLNLMEGIIGGLFEITIGSKLISQSITSLQQKIVAVSFLIGWSGLSINAQATALLSNSGIKVGLYMLIKLLHGMLAALISYFTSSIFFPHSVKVFKCVKPSHCGWKASLFGSIYLLAIGMVFLVLVAAISYLVYKTRIKAVKL